VCAKKNREVVDKKPQKKRGLKAAIKEKATGDSEVLAKALIGQRKC